MNNEIIKDTTIESEAPKNGKKRASFDVAARIIALLFAFILWFYVSSFDTTMSEETFRQIPVVIQNKGPYSVLSGSGSTVDVIVEGSKNIINSIDTDDFYAYVDVSDVAEAGKYSFDITVESPNGVSIISKSADKLSVYMDNTTSMSVPVKLKLTDYMIDDGFELGESNATYSLSEITVTGPYNVIKNIESAQLSAALGHITSSVTYKGSLELIDEQGETVNNSYIKMNTSEVTVYIPLYEYKKVPLTVDYKYGYYTETNSEIKVEPSEITIKGETDKIKDINSINLTTIDEKSVLGDGQYVCNINLPEGITSAENFETAVVSIKHTESYTKELVIDDITVINPSGLDYELMTTSVTIKVRGASTFLSYISSENIEAIADLSNIKNVNGTVIVPLTFSISRLYSSNVYEIGSYSVSVKVN